MKDRDKAIELMKLWNAGKLNRAELDRMHEAGEISDLVYREIGQVLEPFFRLE